MAAENDLTPREGKPAGAAFPSSPAAENCLRAVERIEAIIAQETAALKGGAPRRLGDLNYRKSHGLLELTRAVRALNRDGAAPNLEAHVRGLQAKLRENSAILLMHLEAVQEISTVVSRAIREADSDGTYSASVHPLRQAR